jgi:hypothetical protein
VLVILALIFVTVYLSVKGILKNKQNQNVSEKGEGTERNPVISFPFTVILGILFVWAGIESFQWPTTVKQFPLTAAFFGTLFILFILYYDTRDFLRARRAAGGLKNAIRDASEKAILPVALEFFGYIICIILISLILGQKIALPVFVGIYLWRWGGYGWWISLGYTLGGWVFLVGFYDKVMHLFWHPSWLSVWLPSVLPGWFPAWVII